MSYTIERGKRVLTFKTEDERFSCNISGEILLFVVACSDNNVYPRTYDWNFVGHGLFSDWANEIQLPAKLWEAAYSADGGGIKPYDRDISGIGYIKTWKQAVKQRFPAIAPDGRLLWHPTVSLWAGVCDDTHKPNEINSKGAALFSPKYSHLRQKLYDSFKRLFPKPLDRSNTIRAVYSLESFHDAVFLYIHRRELPFNLYLTDREDCHFLRSGEQQEFLTIN